MDVVVRGGGRALTPSPGKKQKHLFILLWRRRRGGGKRNSANRYSAGLRQGRRLEGEGKKAVSAQFGKYTNISFRALANSQTNMQIVEYT